MGLRSSEAAAIRLKLPFSGQRGSQGCLLGLSKGPEWRSQPTGSSSCGHPEPRLLGTLGLPASGSPCVTSYFPQPALRGSPPRAELRRPDAPLVGRRAHRELAGRDVDEAHAD